MLTPPNTWPKTPTARNVKLFAQLASQQADIATFEGFRMSSLNTLSRVREAQAILHGVTAGRPYDSYNPVKEELVWSLENDSVLDSNEYKMVNKFPFYLKNDNKNDVSGTLSKLEILDDKISPHYKESIESKILECVTSIPDSRGSKTDQAKFVDQNDETLKSLVSSYLSTLTSIGYSREFIIHTVNTYFFKSDIKKVRTARLRQFFNKFDSLDYRFLVYVCVEPPTAEYLSSVAGAEIVDPSSTSATLLAQITACGSSLSPKHKIISFRTKSKDIFSAAIHTHEQIYGFLAASMLGSWSVELAYSRKFTVSTIGHGLVICHTLARSDITRSRKVSSGGRVALNRSIKWSDKLFERINNADSSSRERIINAFTTSYTAVQSQNPEIQIISLWSAFEALLSAPPANVPSRIGHYAKLAVPCIVTEYPRRNFVYVSNSLILNERRSYSNFLSDMRDKTSDTEDAFKLLIYAVTLDEFSDEFDSLINSCSHNPLASFMLASIKRKYGTPKRHIETIDNHEKKVSWQISRIYRARNQIVHSGTIPSFAEALTLNAYEYLSTAISAISIRFSESGNLRKIDNAVEYIGIDYGSNREEIKRLQGSDKFMRDSVVRMFSSRVDD